MARLSGSATGRSFESRAHEVLERWTLERELSATPDDAEAARRYLERLHIRAVATGDGRFLLKDTGQVLDRAELVLLGVRELVVHLPLRSPS